MEGSELPLLCSDACSLLRRLAPGIDPHGCQAAPGESTPSPGGAERLHRAGCQHAPRCASPSPSPEATVKLKLQQAARHSPLLERLSLERGGRRTWVAYGARFRSPRVPVQGSLPSRGTARLARPRPWQKTLLLRLGWFILTLGYPLTGSRRRGIQDAATRLSSRHRCGPSPHGQPTLLPFLRSALGG